RGARLPRLGQPGVLAVRPGERVVRLAAERGSGTVNERIVRRLWLGGAWPRGLPWTSDGTPLQIVFPGRPGHGAGPDLLDAIVALPDGRLLHGDVELHVRTSDWRAHGHDGDARYRRVALHGVWPDHGGPGRASGGRARPRRP